MKKLILLLFGILVALPTISICQNQLAEVTRLWKTVYVPVSDGFVYKYKIHYKSDTAIYYQTGSDTFEVVSTFKKISKVKPPDPPKPDLVTTMDDNVVSVAQLYEPPTNAGDNIQVAGLWTHFKNQAWNAPHYANTVSVLRSAGFVELTCTCYKVEWYSEKRINHGIVAISVDGGPPKDVDLYDPRTDNSSTIVWTSAEMAKRKAYGAQVNTTHKIKISWTGRKNPAATENNYIHDRFVIYTQQP